MAEQKLITFPEDGQGPRCPCGAPLDNPKRKKCAACRGKDAEKARRCSERRREQGLCVSCGKINDTPTSLCSACKERAANNDKTRQAAHRASRPDKPVTCSMCKQPNGNGLSRCDACREKRQAYEVRRREKAEAKGFCIRCFKVPAEEGRKCCAACGKESLDNATKNYRRKTAAGLCVLCRENATGGKRYCESCLEKERARHAERYVSTRVLLNCVRCGVGPLPAKRKWCAACKAVNKAQRMREWRDKYIAEGRCPACAGPQNRPGTNLCSRCLDRIRKRSLAIKKKCIDGYGGYCNCCGERETSFLTVDHVNNDGGERRRQNVYGGSNTGIQVYRWLIKRGFPKDTHQILCMNCQIGRRLNNGVCPHQKKT